MITIVHRYQKARQLLEEAEAISSYPRVKELVPEISARVARIYQQGMTVLSPVAQLNSLSAEFITLQEIKGLKSSASRLKLGFFPLFNDDLLKGNVFAYVVAATEFGSYHCGAHCIQIKMDAAETPRFLACAFLHELGHAWAAVNEHRAGKKNNRSFAARLAEEVNMWSSEYKLMIALGGDEFVKTISLTALELFDAVSQQKPLPFLLQGLGEPLSACLGPPPTSQASRARDDCYLIYCFFYMADHYLQGISPENYKMSFLKDCFMARSQQATQSVEFFTRLSQKDA